MAEHPVVEVESGRMSGTVSDDGAVHVFKGVPYAAPPVGPLRWRPPEPPVRWSGVRACHDFGAACVQPPRHPKSIGYVGVEPQSEDCLFLNIWAPANAHGVPVMVYFHGGAFSLGSGAVPTFDQGHLARRGVVLVTVNYRLGRLGFMAHPALSAETPARRSGNYGLMDQIAALQWVQRNIAAFGGDPGRVTIFGQSAGSIACACLMASPLAKGLFHRVIGQSGAVFGPVGATTDTGDSHQSLQSAEAAGAALCRTLGATTADELRALSAEKLQYARQETGDPLKSGRGAFDTTWAIVDGEVLPEATYDVFRQGRQHDVPLLTGTMANEGATMPHEKTLALFREQAREDFGAGASRFLELFPATDDTEAVASSKRAFAYRNFVWQNWTWVNLQARTGKSPVYYYRIEHAPPIPADAAYVELPSDKFKAYHCGELPYVFGTFSWRDWPWTAEDRRLSDVIMGYWVTFAASGNPNGAGLPAWPHFDPAMPRAMHLAPTPRMAAPGDLTELAFWDEFYSAARKRSAAA